MGQDILISANNLTKKYGTGIMAYMALNVKSLVIRQGEFVAITGSSGCGKTTLMNLLGALDRPSGGESFFRGKNVFNLSEAALCQFRRDKIGFVFQSYHLIPTLSALKNVQLPALTTGSGYKERARELLELVGLSGKEKRLPGELSGGEQQRVAIARALIMNPDLILADEPTGNLDSASGTLIKELFQKLNRQGKTILVATHDRYVAKNCKRVIRLHDGRVAGDEPA
ncbi:MAG: ABC transporter ATP-binding protein [Desulfocucumaceae bacterium]